jgi:hypothetical protein
MSGHEGMRLGLSPRKDVELPAGRLVVLLPNDEKQGS